MPAIAALVLADHSAVNVSFAPVAQTQDGVVTYVSNESVYDAKRKITWSVSQPKSGSSVARIKGKIVIPVMDTVDTSKKLGEAVLNVEAILPKISSDTHRLDLKAFAVALLSHAVSTAGFTSYEGVY